MDTKKLRQKILDLAIRGKLVPQDPNDEPASVLLERIRTEKERLIKEGKIKRSKKLATDEEIDAPFEIPENWEWANVESFTYDLQYGTSEKSSAEGEVPVLRMGNITRVGTVDFTDLVYSSNKDDIKKYALIKDDLLFNRTNSSEWVGKTAIFKSDSPAIYAGYLIRVRCILVCPDFINYVLNSSYHRDWCNQVKTDAVNQSNINAQKLSRHLVPIPPYQEQERIVNEVERWFAVIDALENNEGDLLKAIDQAKSKILDLAIHGKLVPQDPNDEPAIELLKRINPKFEPCDTQYVVLPNGWTYCRLEEIMDYEQPQAYIVQSTDYKPQYTIPVLTAGKSFIIGYTNEENGICSNLPVIIFDDFTTDSRYVNFPFKVKSSAMKILHVKEGVNIQYVCHFMSITRLIGDTHKRYWISEYSKIAIPLPPYQEQLRIVAKIEELFAVLDSIKESLG